MSEHTLLLSGMSCGSCEKIIERVLQKHNAKAKEIDANSGRVVFDSEKEVLPKIIKELEQKGFPQGTFEQRGNWNNVFSFISDSVFGKEGFEVENSVINFSMASAIILILLSAAVLFLFKLKLEITKFAPLIFLVIVFSVATTASYHYMRSYRKRISCQNGMMIGMISGMVIGFLSGALIGATNGMFAGSVVGIAFGVYFGLELGKCCGVMGGLEGVMAGLMSGLMGAMTSVMLVLDNLIIALFLIFAVSVFILGGSVYMMRREAGRAALNEFDVSYSRFILYAVILFFVIFVIMLIVPKSGVTFV